MLTLQYKLSFSHFYNNYQTEYLYSKPLDKKLMYNIILDDLHNFLVTT